MFRSLDEPQSLHFRTGRYGGPLSADHRARGGGRNRPEPTARRRGAQHGRRCEVISLLLVLALLGGTSGESAVNERPSRRERQCRFQWIDKATWTQREEILTAACVEARWPIPGGLEHLKHVIACESGWYRHAYNPAGPYVGLGQHLLSAWDGRVHTYEPKWWTLRPNWRNSRTQLVVTVRMAHRYDWGAWPICGRR